MKKKLSLVLGMILTLSLCLLTACGGGNGNGGGDGDGEKLELAGTAWESEGTAYHFFEDGVVVVDTGYTLSYTWDGNHGEISDGGITAELIYDEDGLFLEGEDEQFYELTRVGEADLTLLLDEEDDSSDDVDDGEELGGAYDNDNEEMSIVFHSDGTCTITSASQQVEGSYTLDANDNLYIETDTDSAEGWYDSSDDTFSLEGLSGWFYYVGSAGYTP